MQPDCIDQNKIHSYASNHKKVATEVIPTVKTFLMSLPYSLLLDESASI